MAEVERIKQKSPGKWIGLGVVLAVVFIVLISSIVVTRENEYTLIKRFGSVERIIDKAGLSFKVPFIDTVATLPKHILLYDLETSEVITMDKKTMVTDSYVLWQITKPKVFVQAAGTQIAVVENRINTTVYNALKNIISSWNQEDVISGRSGQLSEAIMDNIGDSLETYGIVLLDVETKSLDLPSANKTAVYERMISERNQIAASNKAAGEADAKKIRSLTEQEVTIMLAEANAKAEILIAEGEAEYMKILSDAYAGESKAEFYTFLRSLDAAKVAMVGEKTLILSEDSPLAQIFYLNQE